ncbi:MAG: oligosaccharide flippase family protein [Paludibacteraceae bacterium]|nr:oligosaccharide flippase family protein [Paludibacteraceae bacterium]
MNALIKNSARLLSANVIAQAIGLVVYPILTRLYAPEDFGLLNLFLCLGGVLVVLANAEYHTAIVLPDNDRDARSLVHIGWWSSVIVTCVVCLCLPFSNVIASWFKTPDLARWLWLMPVFVLTSALWNILNYWYVRGCQYRRLSGYQYSLSIVTTSAKLGFGYGGWLHGGLVMSAIIGPVVSLLTTIGLGWRKSVQSLFRHRPTRDELRHVALQYKNFPCFNLPRTFLNYVVGQLPVLLLTPMFGKATIGYWGMALLVGFAPVAMINKALYQVLYQQFTEFYHKGMSIRPLLLRFTGMALTGIVVCGVPIGWFMPQLVTWLFGDNWLPVAEILRWMLPWIAACMLVGSTSFLFDIFSKQKQGLYAEILLAVCRCVGLAIGIYYHSFIVAVVGYSLGSAIAIFVQFIWMVSMVNGYESSLKKSAK